MIDCFLVKVCCLDVCYYYYYCYYWVLLNYSPYTFFAELENTFIHQTFQSVSTLEVLTIHRVLQINVYILPPQPRRLWIT